MFLHVFHSNVFVAKSDYEMWGSTDIPINEELLQYRATENYTKKDSQQVNLSEGQTVLVIERCDTGIVAEWLPLSTLDIQSPTK